MNSFSPIAINIASQPLRRTRAQNAALALICAGLTFSLLVLITLILHARAQAGGFRRVINSENAELHRLQREQTQFSAVLAKPENAGVFSTSVFLNEVIARRAVSWTRVFKDLETVMPADMRLMGIRLPQVAAEDSNGANRVQLDMLVGTLRPEAVIDLLKHLQTSSLFGPAQVMVQQPPTQNDPLFKYRVTVAYAQKL
jgi:type IV pilus assembly protein PilN